jgi:hypothetical protein
MVVPGEQEVVERVDGTALERQQHAVVRPPTS